jgi:hypothetical protein
VGWIADVAGPRAGVAVGSMAALLAGAVVLRYLQRGKTNPPRPAEGLLALRA